ncbi:MAG: nucleotidyltransferase family protein [Acidobacteriota bacterium]
MTGAQAPLEVAGIVLAAGTSTRLEAEIPKQLLRLDRLPLIAHVTQATVASRLREVVVVVGHAAAEVTQAVAGYDVRTVENPDYRTGQSSSVRTGLRAIDPRAEAALFLQADQPLITPQLIDQLLVTYRKSGGPIVVPTYAGRRSSPALFDRRLFHELEQLTGDVGGRRIMARNPSRVLELPVDNPLELEDVDTFADLERLANAAGLTADERVREHDA